MKQTFVIHKPDDMKAPLGVIAEMPMDNPWQIEISPYKKNRSKAQNRLQRLWILQGVAQIGWESEHIRAHCKLHFGVPILRAENDDFREAYDRVIKPHSYEDKLAMMAEPLDFPVTRLMNTKQNTQYLDAMYVWLTGEGCNLSEPSDLFNEAMGRK